MKSKLIFLLCTVITIQVCLKDDIENSNQAIFQFIWDDMDQNYGGFIPRTIAWDSIYEIYLPQVVLSNTELELFDICKEMLNGLDDQHIFLYSNNLDEGFSSGEEGDEEFTDKEFD